MGSAYDDAEKMNSEWQNKRLFKGPSRFYLKPGQTKFVIFLDGIPSEGHWEHQFALGEKDWFNYGTCLTKGREWNPDCILCQLKVSKYYIGAFTILDLSPWKDHKEVEHGFSRRLLPAKAAVLVKMKRRHERGQLQFCKWEVFRSAKKADTIGDDWNFVEKLTEAQVKAIAGEDFSLFDYKKIFTPLPKELLESVKDRIKHGTDKSKPTGNAPVAESAKEEDTDKVVDTGKLPI